MDRDDNSISRSDAMYKDSENHGLILYDMVLTVLFARSNFIESRDNSAL